jgi:hypothetical protein
MATNGAFTNGLKQSGRPKPQLSFDQFMAMASIGQFQTQYEAAREGGRNELIARSILQTQLRKAYKQSGLSGPAAPPKAQATQVETQPPVMERAPIKPITPVGAPNKPVAPAAITDPASQISEAEMAARQRARLMLGQQRNSRTAASGLRTDQLGIRNLIGAPL